MTLMQLGQPKNVVKATQVFLQCVIGVKLCEVVSFVNLSLQDGVPAPCSYILWFYSPFWLPLPARKPTPPSPSPTVLELQKEESRCAVLMSSINVCKL